MICSKTKDIIEIYQCPGCVVGSDIECYEEGFNIECTKHITGTSISQIGTIFLGLPKGFNRKSVFKDMKINIFETFETFEKGWKYDKFNIPVWKYLDEHKNTIVRGLSPRINMPFIHIFSKFFNFTCKIRIIIAQSINFVANNDSRLLFCRAYNNYFAIRI